jgi:hypothetical protein
MENINFNYYPANIKDTNAIGLVSLNRFIKSVQNPKSETLHIFEQIKLADERNDQAEKQRLKSKLYYFTPCVQVNQKRIYTDINQFSGLLTLDFDKLEEDYAKEFKQALFDEYKFIIACWLSASKRGVRAFVSIPVCKSIEEFKQYFMAIEFELGIYKGFDAAPKNCVLPMFMSYDKEILFRSDFTTWTKKYIPIEIPKKEVFILYDKDFTNNVGYIVKKAIDKIVNNGHPQLRAAAYALGGYVGAGYINQTDAINLIDKLIINNAYLSQKADIYKKTARTMIIKGMLQPLNL